MSREAVEDAADIRWRRVYARPRDAGSREDDAAREWAIPHDLVIEIKSEPGALARVAAAISDAD
jgi:hypothetical protein